MNGPRVEVTLPIGKGMSSFGTLVGPEQAAGPSEILIDGLKSARLVDRKDWDYLPGEKQETSRG